MDFSVLHNFHYVFLYSTLFRQPALLELHSENRQNAGKIVLKDDSSSVNDDEQLI